MLAVFELTKPVHLLEKMGREIARLRESPWDADHAFNFFVTAEHLLDWLHPGDANATLRRVVRSREPLLEVVWDIASGAKHFGPPRMNHESVAETSARSGYFARNFWPRGMFARDWAEEGLTITLSGEAAKLFGPSIDALNLAEKVLAYWSALGRVPK